MTNMVVINANILWNLIILSIPKNLSKNLAVSPDIIRIERKRNAISPNNLPI